MKLGANSVLFGGFDMATAFKHVKSCGYDGIELSAIDGMSEHLVLERWQELVGPINDLVKEYDLPVLAMEQPRQDVERMEAAFQAAAEIGCPVVNCGPGGKSDVEEDMVKVIDSLGSLSEMAGKYGVTLCVKAHVKASIYNTPTSLRVLEAIDHPNFGLDMDPSHVHRAGENPVEALKAVVSRVKHVHVRDCKGPGPRPGAPEMQSNGRGDIDLLGYFRVLHEAGYTGPVDLEIIGAKEHALETCVMIAAESRGHMQACLQACGAR
jgi:sugar phosphate isomerase/epimerase